MFESSCNDVHTQKTQNKVPQGKRTAKTIQF